MPTDELIAGYERFREKYESDHEVFDRLADEGQNPKVMWIGCSDSRVVPELITGADPGELFIFRNIANVVPPASSPACATGAAVEYAVLHLHVDHVVVCGHTDCGGIAALEGDPAPDSEPHIVSWLDLARPARDAVIAAGVADDARYDETIKTNVLRQLDNLRTYPCIIDGERAGTLKIHGWLYDLHTGTISAWSPGSTSWEPIAERPTPFAEPDVTDRGHSP
jgi:carbonic anhydrase